MKIKIEGQMREREREGETMSNQWKRSLRDRQVDKKTVLSTRIFKTRSVKGSFTKWLVIMSSNYCWSFF